MPCKNNKGFAECDSCINREFDPFECDDCEDASNYEPEDDYDSASSDSTEVDVTEFIEIFEEAA